LDAFSSVIQVWISAPRSGITSVPNSQPNCVRPALATPGASRMVAAITRINTVRTRAVYTHRTGCRYGPLMIDHMGIQVGDLQRGIAFYSKALAPLGYALIMTFEQFAGFGVGGKPDFWIDGTKPATDRIHVAFRAKGRAEVRAFYEAAIAAGGKDNGAPGPRPHYHEHYYGAFVIAPDGHNIEAVCHEPYLG